MNGWSWSRLIASCFGIGRSPIAPGTWGTVLGVVLYVLLLADQAVWVQVAVALAASIIGIIASGRVTLALGQTDPSEVVIDELAGVWVGLIGSTGWKEWALVFLLFRALDVLKPYPANRFEALPGGWGIMCDDLVAGVYTFLVVAGVGQLGLLS